MRILDQILAQKQRELPELRRRRLPAPPPLVKLPFPRHPGDALRLICEIKRKSPSAGELSTALSVGQRARVYEQGGASMISVLCDHEFFGGGFEDLSEARAHSALPLLAKEFIIDESQLDCARAYGASAALLIVRCLSEQRLAELIQACRERELLPLVEVVDSVEAALAVRLGAEAIGVNARDLDTLAMDPQRAEQVLAQLPSERIRAHFSGVKTGAAVAELLRRGLDAALIGEALMRQDDPRPLLEELAQSAAAHG